VRSKCSDAQSASGALLRHVRQKCCVMRHLLLTQLTRLSREGGWPGTRAEEAIWHLAASNFR
jgi:hypothetical protein